MRGIKVSILISLLCIWALTSLNAQNADSISIADLNNKAYSAFLSNPDSSIRIAHQALSLNKGKFSLLQGYSYYVLSKANWAKANYKLSTEYGFKALKIFEKSNQRPFAGRSQLSLARTFIDLRKMDEARSFLKQVMVIADDTGDTVLKAGALREYSKLLTEKQQFDSAISFADEGIKIYEELNDTLNASILYSRKAKIWFLKKDYRKSSSFNLKALVLDSLVHNQRALAVSYLLAAKNAFFLNKRDSALVLALRSRRINEKIHNMEQLVEVHQLLADIYLDENKPLLAVSHLKSVNQYKDSLFNDRKMGQIQEMQALYELEQKDKVIRNLEAENAQRVHQVESQRWMMIMLLVGMFLLGALIIMLMRLRTIQANANAELNIKNKAIEQQREEIQSQAENLQELNQLKSKLFSVISHDLRGPIATLQTLLELLTNKKMTSEEFFMISEKLQGNLNVTQRTLENLLNWSLSQMEGIKTNRQKLRIAALIEDTHRLMEEAAQRKNIEIQCSMDGDYTVYADADQVNLILRNLVHNAIKFSKQNGSVSIHTTSHQNYCVVKVEDSGIGMTPEEIETIFASNKHFTKTGTHQEKGTGIGLLLCQEFIKRNGGTLSINSTPGSGTIVSFTLQLA
jgi:signal transduction histidine kinase